MPYSYPQAIPAVAKSWTPTQQKACVGAANAVLQSGGSEENAVFACIHAAGKSKGNDKVDALIAAKTTLLASARAKKQSRRLPKPPPKPKVKALQLQYIRLLLPMVATIRQLNKEILIPAIDGLLRVAKAERPDHMDGWVDSMSDLLARLRVGFYRKHPLEQTVNIAAKAAETINSSNDKYYDKLIKKLGVGGAKSEIWLNEEIKGFIKNNVRLIDSVPDRYLNKVETTITTGLQQGWTVPDIAEALSKATNIAENDWKLIARDQTSKFNGALDMFRQKEVGIQKYRWRTSEDERVRETHEANNGEVFEWDDPTPGQADGRPGEEINCRCYAEPIFDNEKEE